MKRLFLTIFLCAFTLAAGPARATETTPDDVISQFQNSLIALMKESRFMGIKERYEWLRPKVAKAFAVPVMAQMATGAHWRQAPPAERQRFVDAFRRYNLSYIATLFNGYSGQTFHVVGDRPGPQHTVVVTTRLDDPDGSKIQIAYFMTQIGGSWKAVDVIVNGGISEIRTRQSEFSGILGKGGLPALSTSLEKKADELLGTSGSGS